MKSWRALILGITLVLIGAAAGAAQTIVLLDGAPTEQQSNDAQEKAAPAAPTKLQALAVLTDRIFLIWQDNSNNETSFRVEQSTGGAGGPFVEIGSTPANNVGVFVVGLSPSTSSFFRVRARNADGNSAYSNVASDTTRTINGCTGSTAEMCLNNNRFRVQALFQTDAASNGQAQTVKLTSESGYLWFFSASNIEIVVKVLNGCGVNTRYWVFAAGLTNVRVGLAVTDTQLLTSRVYVNPLNTAFQPIQDTAAFATCP